MKKILITEPFYNKKQLNLLKKKYLIHFLDNNASQKYFEKLNIKNKYYAIFTKLGLSINDEFLKKNYNLKYVFTPTTGNNHINFKKYQQCKIISLKNSKIFLKSVTSTAEHAWLLFMESQKNSQNFNITNNNINWTREESNISQLSKKNIGIIGLGRIGRLIAKYAMSFGMNVFYTDNKNIYCSKKYKKKSLQLILKQAEFIFLCASYDGKCILNSSVLKSINKPINTLINVSRGELIDEEALSKIIKKKLILKYFTDVLDSDSIWNKKEYKNNPIYKLSKFYNNRIFITPHIGGYSQEAILETRNHVMTKALKVLL